ncbi:MAG: AGE family epimerase/isomerase, partial [Ginsengibacter sp.]
MEISQQLIPVILGKYKKELDDELMDILLYWIQHTVDRKKGGFYGAVDFNNVPDKKALKGIVLNSRILWTFSAATLFGLDEYEVIADRAFNYIEDHFRDGEYGGVYWSVNATGTAKEYKKQIYGQAFCIYSLSEYYKLSKNPQALEMAVELYSLIEKYSYDEVNGGYVEAFTRDWKEIADLRLSDKDANEKKTMNTHLHIIEAYANLYTVWRDESLLKKIKDLLSVFHKHIIDTTTHHLHLFMTEDWNVKSSTYSFGHDIEAAWLLLECAQHIEDSAEIALFKKHAVSLSKA